MPPGESIAPESERPLALAALFAGAVAIGASPLFVKVSEAGPVSTAFWRVFLALPFLWAWTLAVDRSGGAPAQAKDERRLMAIAGAYFAGDLAVWHWSIVLTTVATATLLANLAPIFVTLAVWLVFGQRPALRFLAGLAMAVAGNQLTVTRLRATTGTARIMAWSGMVSAALLLPVALLSGEQLFPSTAIGWLKLVGLALVAQVAGQSLIAYAMAHLPPRLSSVGLLLQPVVAALFAWVLLGETLGEVQLVGALMVLIGIRIAHQAEAKR